MNNPQLSRKEKKLLNKVEIASKIVLKEDKNLLKELAKEKINLQEIS